MTEQAAAGAGAGGVRAQLDRRTSELGSQARTVAAALRRSGSDLEEADGAAAAGRLTTGLADRLERVGGYLEQAHADDVLREIERFARRRPGLVAGMAAAAGFTASRLLKASSAERFEQAGGRPPARAAEPRPASDRAEEIQEPAGHYPPPPTTVVGPTGVSIPS